MSTIKAGLTNTIQRTVTVKDTASAYGSGLVEVFATPAMIALMEATALKSVEPLLEDNQTTVGFEVNVRHFKAVGVGEQVTCKSMLELSDGRKLQFKVEVTHGDTTVGKGTHTRYVVDKTNF
jgi:predicted thioesterase